MPSTPSDRTHSALAEIERNILLARDFLEGFDLAEFSRNDRTIYAVTRCLEIISEASRRLPDEMKLRHPAVPWSQIAGAGNVYRHNYEIIEARMLWETVRHELDALHAAVEFELAR